MLATIVLLLSYGAVGARQPAVRSSAALPAPAAQLAAQFNLPTIDRSRIVLDIVRMVFDSPDAADPADAELRRQLNTLLAAGTPGETAPLLFTVLGNQFWSTSLTEPIAALPLQIFTFAISPYEQQHALAWAGALVLIGIVLVISLAARFATRSRFGRGGD